MECEVSWTRSLLWVAAIAISGFTACNYTEGECHPRGQGGGSAGVGGGVIVPAGAGGFGEVPPKPQDATDPPPPDCNIATQSPCNEKCLADYEAAAAECGKIENDSLRTTCQDGALASYEICRDNCQQVANQECDDKYQDCVDNGPSSCLDQEGGKTQCNRCWERCNAGDSPSAKCRNCRF